MGLTLQKSVFKSKTFYFGLATALSPLIPSVGTFIAENTAQVSMVWGALSILLRLVTKEKVVLVD